MELNEKLHGFLVKSVLPLPELEGRLVQMEHERSGARLVWLDRPDENKTFCIAFRTLPENHTGIFHILEHSVLNGSDKYPVKEPFVELMKSSMNTFLNAITFGDKTCYPVSSRNYKDFLNLTRVYMDAVLHPLIYSKPEIFRQEGWHYEMPKDGGDPIYKGVVFNEMKGALSSPDRLLWEEVQSRLFPDNGYAYNSGGDPKHIPELTYEQFLEGHRRFYHPSNSYIILDGRMDIGEVLSILDGEYLAAYERRTDLPEFVLQEPVCGEPARARYEISPNESAQGKAHLAWGRVTGSFDSREDLQAMQAILDVLCGGSQSPLKRKIVSAGLGQDVLIDLETEFFQPYLMLHVVNMDEDRVDEVNAALREELERLVREGLDHGQLEAALANQELRLRERDFEYYPQGLGLGMTMLESWLYGGDPAANLEVGDLFVRLRKKLEEGYFEALLERFLLHNPHGCEVLLLPSATLGEEQRAAEAKRLQEAAAGWSEAERSALRSQQEALDAWQASVDTPEALASIPTLALSDIPDKPTDIPLETGTLGKVPLLRHSMATGGVGYVNLYFDITDLSEEQLSQTALLCALLGELDTAQYGGLELQRLKRLLLGKLEFTVEPCGRPNAPGECRSYLCASFSALEGNLEKAAALATEVITGTKLDDAKRIRELLRQRLAQFEQSMVSGGHRLAMWRVHAGYSVEGMVREHTAGIACYQWLKALEKEFGSRGNALIEALSALRERIFTTGRLTVGVTGPVDACQRALEQALGLPETERQEPACAVRPWGKRREGVVIPAGVSFAALGGSLLECGAPFSGTVRVMGHAASLEYLWNAVRVQGGAYGAGLDVRSTGVASFYSYRDPSAVRSLDCYRQTADFLRSFCASGPDLTGLITGTAADSDPLMMPSRQGKTFDLLYLRGTGYAERCRERQEILAATPEALTAAAEALSRLERSGGVCVVGSRAHVERCGQELDSILVL